MNLSDEILGRYAGGQLEIQNQHEDYLFRGEVERAWLEGSDLHVTFKWIAKMGDNSEWHVHPDLNYAVNLEIISVSDIGQGRIHYSVMFVWERGTFFPPDGSKLDPKKVIGLQLSS